MRFCCCMIPWRYPPIGISPPGGGSRDVVVSCHSFHPEIPACTPRRARCYPLKDGPDNRQSDYHVGETERLTGKPSRPLFAECT